MATERQRRIARALTALIPRAPFLDAEAIRTAARSAHMRSLGPEGAVWLAAIARIRHEYTDYDALMDEGYDKDSARFFVLDAVNDRLDRWGATRRLDPDAVDTADGADADAAAMDAEERDADEDDASSGEAGEAARFDRRVPRTSPRRRRAQE